MWCHLGCQLLRELLFGGLVRGRIREKFCLINSFSWAERSKGQTGILFVGSLFAFVGLWGDDCELADRIISHGRVSIIRRGLA